MTTKQEPQQVPVPAEPAMAKTGPAYVARVAIAFGVGTLFLLAIATVWAAGHVLLVLFSSILFAVLLNGASTRIARWLPLSRNQSLALVLILLVLIVGATGYFLAPQVAEQIDPLVSILPESVKRLQEYLKQYGWLREIMQSTPPAEQLVGNALKVLSQASVVFSGALGIIANCAIILFVGIYLAAQPHVYVNGALKLVPFRHRARGKEIFEELGTTLELWLFGKLISMIVVGVATATGLILLDVPLAITLGVIAGMLDFIPYLGPIMAGVPALLMAFSASPVTAIYVFFLFVAIQTAESYLLAPLVERQTVLLPPALTITMQVLLAVPFGLAGIALASPLTAVICVLIAMLYVQSVLHDPVKTPGE